MVSLLKQFISFQSIEGNNEEKQQCLDWIQLTFLEQSPHKIHRDEVEGSPYIYLEHPHPDWIWFAHTDVVPAESTQWELKQDGDRLLGRGVKDMKGAALPFLMAYRDEIVTGKCPAVSLLLTSDEETAGPTIPLLLKEGLVKGPIAFTPDTGSTDAIVVEHKGVIWAEITAEGKGGHSAIPWKSQNPIHLLAKCIQILEEKYPIGTDEDWQITVTPTQLSGSDARNKVPDAATCGIDIRYPPQEGKSPEEIVKLVQGTLPSGCTVSILLAADPLQTDPSLDLVQCVKKEAEAVVGSEIPIKKEHGATDARFFAAAGIPAFLYGPIGGGLHAKDEWVSHSSLCDQYSIMQNVLRSYQPQ